MRSIFAQTALQSGDNQLQYIIVDGVSTDDTLAIVNRVAQDAPPAVELTVISEPDETLYDGLCKGFVRAKGDIVSYLNAGDIYSPHALQIVNDLFTQHGVRWLTGMSVTYNEAGQLVSAVIPYRYRRAWFQQGAYRLNPLPFVQQESTFWHRDLMQQVDYDVLRTFKCSGDYYMWQSFATVEHLAVVSAHLGGFRVHQGQVSGGQAVCMAEIERITPFDEPAHTGADLY